jgi:hypothetical protein
MRLLLIVAFSAASVMLAASGRFASSIGLVADPAVTHFEVSALAHGDCPGHGDQSDGEIAVGSVCCSAAPLNCTGLGALAEGTFTIIPKISQTVNTSLTHEVRRGRHPDNETPPPRLTI